MLKEKSDAELLVEFEKARDEFEAQWVKLSEEEKGELKEVRELMDLIFSSMEDFIGVDKKMKLLDALMDPE